MDNYQELSRILSPSPGQLLQFVISVPTCCKRYTYHLDHLIGSPKDKQQYVLRDFIPERMHATFYKPDIVATPFETFFDVKFWQLVYPTKIGFYKKTFPRNMARIWAKQYGKGAEYSLIWDRRHDGLFGIGSSDLFLPIIRTVQHRTRELRFEFHMRHAFYSDIHGIALVGVAEKPKKAKLASRGTPNTLTPVTNVINITQLPYEVLFKIFSYLKIHTLCVVEQVCETFATVVADALLYREVYQCFPYEMECKHLRWLSERCSGIKKLDLTKWVMFHKFKTDMDTLIRQHGHTLTHIRLTTCSGVSEIPFNLTYCPNLTELGLHNLNIDRRILSEQSNYDQLIKLDLTGSRITTDVLVSLLQRNPKLQHLKLMFCGTIDGHVIETIGKYNPELISLNVSYTYDMKVNTGLAALKNCIKLQELNLGRIRRYQIEECLVELMGCIPGIRWLGLAGGTQVNSHVLAKIATHCPELQFLDLDACHEASGESVDAILAGCPKLRLLKLADCGQIESRWFNEWERLYPLVKIENSQSEAFEVQAVAMSFPTRVDESDSES